MPTSSTSIPEQAIFFYVKRFFPDSINRKKFSNNHGKKYEADVFVPSARVAIEYNGAYWHENRLERDIEKNLFFSDNGIFTIIVFEGNLIKFPIKNGITLTRGTKEYNGLHMNEVITAIINEISKHTDDTTQTSAAAQFQLSYNQYEEDYPEILKSIFKKTCANNITSNCIFSMWDHEKNRGIDPICVPQNTTAKFWFHCPDGHSFRVAPGSWNHPHLQHDKCSQNCSVCAYNICPFLSQCPPFSKHAAGNLRLISDICQHIQNHVWSCILGDCEWPQKFGSQLHMMIITSDSNLEMEMLWKYFDPETTVEERRRIKYAICHPFDLEEGEAGYVQLKSCSTKEGASIIRVLNGRTIEDLEICEKVMLEWNCMVLIRFANYQDSGEKQKAACKFLEGVIRYWEKDRFVLERYLNIIKNPFCSGDLNEEFKNKLREVVKMNHNRTSIPIS